MRKVAFYTFGCKVNQYETENLKILARNAGFEIVPFGKEADLIFINSCAVTHVAERKARRLINLIKNRFPNAKIALAGCYAERLNLSSEKLVLDFVLDNKQKWEFFGGSEDSTFVTSEDRARAILKIQDGCNNFCTYCIVPYLRGRERSKPFDKVMEEAQKLVENGFKEIVLTGIRLGAYGRDLGDKDALSKLLLKLFEMDGLVKIRLSSIEPMDITEGLIKLADHPKLCKHWHIPLQSGDDEILKKMNRRYDTKYFEQIVYKLREKVPDVAITTDIIVGYPEESEENFNNTYLFAERMGFMRIHVFPYSPRPFTPAYKLKPLPYEVITKRKEKLIKLSNDLWERYVSKFIEKELEVMVEERKENLYRGTTDNYIKVEFESNLLLKEGEYIKVRLLKVDNKEEKVWGEVLESKVKVTL
ncbi:tRNA (N(6)-L-threonylcarbamoyladenosine(37)-C(2))-methylthiotransferase MtaB [Dictyoglomus turgidum]|mgnify:CR=1 FL=1|uniref:tRNA (N(6)-L-threonylcarbamoyladenosine(37)-C(2))- methylthiotransferase MtaB n=1 Tax=Dictyoglomus turgidum TaxID=513050 RepID=UPI00235429B1|nr:tRNA (N(6)-L-threonylcarbamoyladenosine(37)-C(2))-methylthiotransferase MtaB [Dictyoglomus turgidum]